MQLHVLDGTYELFRSHFGAPAREAPDGRAIGATRGIIASTLALLQEPGVTHVAAAFDTHIRSFRNDIFAGYKTEAGVPEELLAQFPIAERALAALGVTVWSMVEYEADDAIATAAARYRSDFARIVMLTPDKDLAQCVTGETVVGFDRRKGEFIDQDGVRAKFGVEPASIPDYLALVGDSADGLPGVPGWGAKTSGAMLARYGHLEHIPLDPGAWDAPVRGAARLAASLRDHIPAALLYRYLATLRRDVPLAERPDQLEWVGVHREPFEELCDELGFADLRGRPHRWAAL